jgi:hypothetical protein
MHGCPDCPNLALGWDLPAGYPSLIAMNDLSSPTGGVDVSARLTAKETRPRHKGPESHGRFREWLPAWLGRGWWVGLGVILAAAGTAAGLMLSSGGSSSYSNHGDCDAQGTGNTVMCSGTDTKVSR